PGAREDSMIFGWFRRSASDQHEPDVSVPKVGELILPREAADSSDPYELIACNIDWINFLFSDGKYMPDEMIQEPIWRYQVDYYLQQVNNGGHGQYVGNSDILNENWGSVEATQLGLAAMGAEDFAAIYADLIALLGANRNRAEAIAAGRGFGDIDPAISA